LIDYEAGEAVALLIAENKGSRCPWTVEELGESCRSLEDGADPEDWCPACVADAIEELQAIQTERKGGKE
jgi:hypothetical protein